MIDDWSKWLSQRRTEAAREIELYGELRKVTEALSTELEGEYDARRAWPDTGAEIGFRRIQNEKRELALANRLLSRRLEEASVREADLTLYYHATCDRLLRHLDRAEGRVRGLRPPTATEREWNARKRAREQERIKRVAEQEWWDERVRAVRAGEVG